MNIRFPSSVALTAAIVVSILCIVQKCTFEEMAIRLVITIVVFFVLGFICRFMLDDIFSAGSLEELDLDAESEPEDTESLGDMDAERISELQLKSEDDK